MKKHFKALRTKCGAAFISAKERLANKRAEGYVDSGVKILIAVVIGSLLLVGLYTLINNDVLSPLHDKIANMFAYEP